MRQEKQMLLDEIKGHMKKSDSFLIMSYKGLSANATNEFRCALAENGGELEMVRKRVLFKAAEQAGVELDKSVFGGHIGLVFGGNDPLEVTKTVFKFSKSTNDAIAVVGGRFEGKLLGSEEVKKLSMLPSRDEMRAQLLSVLIAPMTQTLATMDAVLSSVIYCLDNKVKQGEGTSK